MEQSNAVSPMGPNNPSAKPMTGEYRYHECSHIGVSGTTAIVIRKTAEGYEARMGFALMGHTNMNEDGFRAAEFNPFHGEFYDNYVKGVGLTEDEAMAAMKNDLNEISESLWI